jgi:hypothetical protein
MARKTLQEIARHPEGASLRELLGALQRAGWSLKRHGSRHDIWSHGGVDVEVPRHDRGIGVGTMRKIANRALTAEVEDRDGNANG